MNAIGKLCVKCNIEKEFDSFVSDKSVKSGKKNICKACANLKERKRPSSWFKNRRYKQIYGLTLTQVESILNDQDQKCPICCAPLNLDDPLKVHVDHCHVSGKVRGILCYSCNLGLGSFKDNPIALKNAANYIESPKTISHIGLHLLAELSQCNIEKLKDIIGIEKHMKKAAEKSNATIVSSFFQPFEPFGVSGAVILAESHFSIHTWAENAYASMDFYVCGTKANPFLGLDYMKTWLESPIVNLVEIKRGIPTENPGIYTHSTYINEIT